MHMRHDYFVLSSLLSLGLLVACGDDGGTTSQGTETEAGDGDGDGDGDGETAEGNSGDGDGDMGDGDGDTGDGDGDTGDGDGDTGDGDGDAGDGDGDGDPIGEPPLADIFHPGDGEDRQVNMPIPMIGEATDAEDGMLTGMTLVWTSDIEGDIGTGEMFDWAPTMLGMQTITLTVVDSDNNEGTDSVTINVIP